MDDKEQKNKKHLVGKAGRKFREDNKVKVGSDDREIHQDSRGHTLIKSKRKVDRINKKAFAIQNVAKAKKKVSMVVDRQTSQHTFKTKNEPSFDSPCLIALMGPANSGKSTLMRTLMRHFTGGRKHIQGPVTVVSSKKKRVTLLECSNDLGTMTDIAKVSDIILLLINLKQGLQTETLELIEVLNAHGVPRVFVVYTHLDEYPRHDKKSVQKMKEITKRVQTEIHAKTFQLTECKQMREVRNSEYKIEEVKNLARMIGQKNPLPNLWRNDHPYMLVDRIEKVERESKGDTDSLRCYGFVRGCHMSTDLAKMHMMGVHDVVVKSITVLEDPCPTPYQESLATTKMKRQPLAMKERKAYAPMCGYGGVLKDGEGFHIVSQGDAHDRDESDVEDAAEMPKSSLVREFSDDEDSEEGEGESEEEEEEEDGPPAKKRFVDSTLAEDFDELQNDMFMNNNAVNYERLVYDEDYSAPIEGDIVDGVISKDLFVSGKWGENEDAATLLKKDDENRKNEEMDEGSDDEGEEEEEEDDIDAEESDEECNIDENECNDDDEEEEYDMDEEEGDMEEEDGDMEVDEDDDEKSTDLTEGWTADTSNLTDFQKKKMERDLKTKRQKKLEKKEKHKALFDKLYDEKSGGANPTAFFDKWKEDNEEREKVNKEAFEHVEKENVHKFSGIKPGTYVAIEIADVSADFFKRFKPSRPAILGGLAPGEESYAMLTGKMKLHRHFNMAQVIKNLDPMCFSIGWRRIQSFCNFYKEEHNMRKTYLKYSATKSVFCYVTFRAPVVPVKTGFVMLPSFKSNPQFRIAAVGSVVSKENKVDIKKKLKRKGYPIEIFKKTAFVGGMFVSELEVEHYLDSRIQTTSGVRGIVKKALGEGYEPGSFRATFEAPIQLADIVTLTCWASADMLEFCQHVSNLLTDDFQYWPRWNNFKKENNMALPEKNPDSEYKKIERPVFVAEEFKCPKKMIDQLPFMCRPHEEAPEDLVQKKRPKVVLGAKESKAKQLLDNLMTSQKERKQKRVEEKLKYNAKKSKEMKEMELKKQIKEKEKRKKYFKKEGRNTSSKSKKTSK